MDPLGTARGTSARTLRARPATRVFKAAVVAATMSIAMATGAVAVADNVVADGDGLSPLVSNNTVAFGSVCKQASPDPQKNVLFRIDRAGQGSGQNVYANGATVSVTGSASGAELTTTTGSITLAPNWVSLANNSMSATTTSTVTLDPSLLPTGAYTGSITFSATGARSTGGSLTRMVAVAVTATIQDCNTPPTLGLPADIVAEAEGPGGAVVGYLVTATDAEDDPDPTPSCSPPSGSTFGVGETTVNCSVSDSAGATTTGSFTVIVEDTTAPILSLANLTAEATGPAGAAVAFSISASDLVDGSVDVSCDATSGDTFPLGTSTVNCSATDTAGNTATGSFTVDVVDTTPPALTLPTDISGIEATGPTGAAVVFSASASDIVDGDVAVSCDWDPGDTFPLGTSTVNCSATDAAGNAANGSFTVTVVDTTPPTIALVSALPAPNDAGWNNSDVTVTWSCSDLVGVLSPTVTDVVETEGTDLSASATCEDTSGNTASDTYTGIDLDETAPSLAWNGGPADGSSHYFGSVPAAATCTAADSLSGPNGCTVTGYSAAVGVHTMTATANDVAGNAHSEQRSYAVLAWSLYGFYQPVDTGSSVWNTVKNGSTVPLKFQVFAGTTELTATSVVDQPLKATQTPCSGGTVDEVEMVATGGTALRYDGTGGQFVYNWQTPKKPGYCYVVTVVTADGSSISANFKLK